MEPNITKEAQAAARSAIREIAAAQGITEKEVRKEMMAAMRAGMDDPDPKVRARWQDIPCRGEEPTVEEFVAWMAEYVHNGVS